MSDRILRFLFIFFINILFTFQYFIFSGGGGSLGVRNPLLQHDSLQSVTVIFPRRILKQLLDLSGIQRNCEIICQRGGGLWHFPFLLLFHVFPDRSEPVKNTFWNTVIMKTGTESIKCSKKKLQWKWKTTCHQLFHGKK